jgi:hypothetical protein
MNDLCSGLEWWQLPSARCFPRPLQGSRDTVLYSTPAYLSTRRSSPTDVQYFLAHRNEKKKQSIKSTEQTNPVNSLNSPSPPLDPAPASSKQAVFENKGKAPSFGRLFCECWALGVGQAGVRHRGVSGSLSAPSLRIRCHQHAAGNAYY